MTTKGSDGITNSENVIDPRDVIARIEYLQDERDSRDSEREDDSSLAKWEEDNPEDAAELVALLKLQDEAQGSPDWMHGETLIADSYFREYAEQLADDCGMIPDNATWPLTHIDWDAAANELKGDYFEVDFDGTPYWIRA